MSNGRIDSGAGLSAEDQLEMVVSEIAARIFPSRSSMNTYIGFQLRCGRLKRELRAYISIYRDRFDRHPGDDHLMAAGECIYPLFEKRDDWQSLSSLRQESLVVVEARFGQIQHMANLRISTPD